MNFKPPVPSECQTNDHAPGKIDKVSKRILQKMQPMLLKEYSPRYALPDGNCLYRAISLGLYNTDVYHTYIRLLTSIEMILHREDYDVTSDDYRHTITDSRILTSSYTNLIHSVTKNGSSAELMHLYAISAVIHLPISSFCPLGSLLVSHTYSICIYGRGVRRATYSTVTVMWTMLGIPNNLAVQFHPNHFALLARISKNDEHMYVSSSDSAEDVSSQTRVTLIKSLKTCASSIQVCDSSTRISASNDDDSVSSTSCSAFAMAENQMLGLITCSNQAFEDSESSLKDAVNDVNDTVDDTNKDPDYVPESGSSVEIPVMQDFTLDHKLPCKNLSFKDCFISTNKLPCDSSFQVLTRNSIVRTDVGNLTTFREDRQSNNIPTSTNGDGVTVMTTDNWPGKRSYDKVYFCLYCDEPRGRIKPHLESQHSGEPDVVEMMAKINKSEKNQCLTKIRNLGNHKHNCDVLQKGQGAIVVVYRPTDKDAALLNAHSYVPSYVPCSQCFGYYEGSQMWKHCKFRCAFKEQSKHSKSNLQKGRLLLPAPNSIMPNLKEIISNMKRDKVYQSFIHDDLIIGYAQKLTLKHFSDPGKHEYVRNKIRELGRLLLVLKTDYNIQSISDGITPANFQKVIAAVRKVTGFNDKTISYTIPSLALKLGHALNSCAENMLSEGLQKTNKLMQRNAETFIRLYEIEWSSQISSSALKTLDTKKMNKIKVLPLARDISKLSNYLKNIAGSSIAQLNSSSTELPDSAWLLLVEATVAQLVLFNRRRSGEVSKMLISTYMRAATGTEQNRDIYDYLSPVEKTLCSILMRVEIPGKRGRTVPLLLTEKFKEAIDCIIKYRSSAHVLDTNEYIFAQPHRSGHVRCTDVLRKYSVECGAEAPEALRSTALRKHVATMSQILNLKDNELDLIAQFLGHDVRVHREFYRLPLDVLQTAKVSKLLMAMESGQPHQLIGRSLEDIELNLDS